jgi:hypothetical protein
MNIKINEQQWFRFFFETNTTSTSTKKPEHIRVRALLAKANIPSGSLNKSPPPSYFNDYLSSSISPSRSSLIRRAIPFGATLRATCLAPQRASSSSAWIRSLPFSVRV